VGVVFIREDMVALAPAEMHIGVVVRHPLAYGMFYFYDVSVFVFLEFIAFLAAVSVDFIVPVIRLEFVLTFFLFVAAVTADSRVIITVIIEIMRCFNVNISALGALILMNFIIYGNIF
jgi:hypothetical protein